MTSIKVDRGISCGSLTISHDGQFLGESNFTANHSVSHVRFWSLGHPIRSDSGDFQVEL